MYKKRRHSIFTLGLLLGIGIPGLIGILVVQASTIQGPDIQALLALQSGPTFTLTPALTETPLPSSTSTGIPLTGLPPLSGTSTGTLYAFIQAPSGFVSQPYVLLSASGFLTRAQYIVINGYVNSDEFVCSEFPCLIYLKGSSRFIFRAYSDTGVTSDEVIASVSVNQGQSGYLVTIDSVSQFTKFSDACSAIWGVRDEENEKWDDFVQFPYQLNTRKTYHTLATQLILNGVVNTKDCPYGGLSSGLNWPTACGLEKASSAMIQWQNQYDGYIWVASRDQGIPPKILKTLLGFESQFWPGNSRFYLDEYGLGQINQLGMDVLLRNDARFYQQVCSTIFADCSSPYLGLEASQQKLIRGAAASLVDASCADCPYGVDLDRAKQSVDIISRLLKANCQQVDAILGADISDAKYEDLWRFTLSNYHSGVSCFQNAVSDVKDKDQPVTWENLSKQLKCQGGVDYVNGFMDDLFSFDFYLYEPGDDVSSVAALPTIVPTRTPIPTPTVYISNARIIVQVYLDRNRNGVPDVGEEINAMTVEVNTSDNKKLTERTQNGIATFDMTGFTPGIRVEVVLPGLYRSETFTLPQQGEIPVSFKFDMPALPTSLP